MNMIADGNTAALRQYEAKKDADESAWEHHAPAVISGLVDRLMNLETVKLGNTYPYELNLADFFEPGMMTPDECALSIAGTAEQWQEAKERIQKRTCENIRDFFEDNEGGQAAVWDRINDEDMR